MQGFFKRLFGPTAPKENAGPGTQKSADAAWWRAQRLMASYDLATETFPDGMADTILQCIRTAIDCGGKNEAFYYGTLAQLQMMTHDFESAYRTATHAIDLDANNQNFEAVRIKANAAWMLQRFDEAETLFVSLENRFGENPVVTESLRAMRADRASRNEG